MQQTILIARDRKTDQDIVLCGREIPYPEQRARYEEFVGTVHEEYSSVGLFYLEPAKRPLIFLTQSEAEARVANHKKLVANAARPVKPAAEPKNLAAARQAVTNAETDSAKAHEAYLLAKKAYGTCTDVAQKLILESKVKERKNAARAAINALETARQELNNILRNPPVPPVSAPAKEPTAAEKRETELMAMNRGDLLALVEKLKADGKAIDTGGKSKKSDLANAILKTEGFEITAPETAE